MAIKVKDLALVGVKVGPGGLSCRCCVDSSKKEYYRRILRRKEKELLHKSEIE